MFYIYVKNWKIKWSSQSDKLNLWKPFAVELPWYYRLVDWVPKMTLCESDLDKKVDVFVWNRNWIKYYEKRKEATWKDKLEDTRWNDELKNIANEENVDNVEDE